MKKGYVLTILLSIPMIFTIVIPIVKAPGVTGIFGLDVYGPPWEMFRGRTYRYIFQVQLQETENPCGVEISYWLSPSLDPLIVTWYPEYPTIEPPGGVCKDILFVVTVPFDAPIKDYTASLSARFRPIGGNVVSSITQSPRTWRVKGPVSATVDVDPDTLNVRSNGEWITTYIELEQGFDLNDIEAATIKINGTIAGDLSTLTQTGDYDSDGTPDLMMKFSRVSIVEWLGTTDYSQETGRFREIRLTITGTITGLQFTGADTIRLLQP